MENSQVMDNCLYNLLYTQFNEYFGNSMYFSYDMKYPIFYNLKNSYFFVPQSILSNINSTIKSDALDFKEGIAEEEEEYNKSTTENALPKKKFKSLSSYSVTFSKNHILSVTLSLMGFAGDFGPTYNSLNNYNFDLLTGNPITIKDVFNNNVDYIKVVTDYINYKINQNRNLYNEDLDLSIPEDQAFYLTDDGLVIYFGVDEIAPAEFGIPKFKMTFSKFAPYINPRFYCSATNVFYDTRRHSSNRNFSRR